MRKIFQLYHRGQRFFTRPARERRLLLEAVAWLLAARLCIVLLPFRWYARVVKNPPPAPSMEPLPAALLSLLHQVRWAVETAARVVPWNAVCLPQAMAAQRMLARRGIASLLYLGIAKQGPDRLSGHAWLQVNQFVVVGQRGMNRFTVATTLI